PFLREVAAGGQPGLGRQGAVYGGGNTPMDAARPPRRLGAGEGPVVYPRTRAPVAPPQREGAGPGPAGGRVTRLRPDPHVRGAEAPRGGGEADEDGDPRPAGRVEELRADTVILALGQDADTGFLRTVPGVRFRKDGTVEVSPQMMTGCPGVFAGGDMVPAERTV